MARVCQIYITYKGLLAPMVLLMYSRWFTHSKVGIFLNQQNQVILSKTCLLEFLMDIHRVTGRTIRNHRRSLYYRLPQESSHSSQETRIVHEQTCSFRLTNQWRTLLMWNVGMRRTWWPRSLAQTRRVVVTSSRRPHSAVPRVVSVPVHVAHATGRRWRSCWTRRCWPGT